MMHLMCAGVTQGQDLYNVWPNMFLLNPVHMQIKSQILNSRNCAKLDLLENHLARLVLIVGQVRGRVFHICVTWLHGCVHMFCGSGDCMSLLQTRSALSSSSRRSLLVQVVQSPWPEKTKAKLSPAQGWLSIENKTTQTQKASLMRHSFPAPF